MSFKYCNSNQYKLSSHLINVHTNLQPLVVTCFTLSWCPICYIFSFLSSCAIADFCYSFTSLYSSEVPKLLKHPCCRSLHDIVTLISASSIIIPTTPTNTYIFSTLSWPTPIPSPAWIPFSVGTMSPSLRSPCYLLAFPQPQSQLSHCCSATWCKFLVFPIACPGLSVSHSVSDTFPSFVTHCFPAIS